MNKKFILTVLTGAVALVGSAFVSAEGMNMYIGIGAGQSEVQDISASDIDALLASEGLTSSTSLDDTDTAWKIFAGYQINQNFAIEAGYVDLGEMSADITVTLPEPGSAALDMETDAVVLSLVGSVDVMENFSLMARIGYFRWSSDLDLMVSDGVFALSLSGSDDGNDVIYGVGCGYDFMDNLGARVEWERYSDVLDDTDIDVISASLLYRF